MNHTKCTIYTFRNRLWPFDRTRSGKKSLVFTRLLLFFGGLIAQINLANSTCTTVRLCTLHLRTFPQTMQLPPEESNSTSQFALQQATVKTAKSSKPDGPAAGKTRAEVTRPARRYFQDLDCGQTFCFSCRLQGYVIRSNTFFFGLLGHHPPRGAEPKDWTGFQSLAT